jgi:hypothetical protein
MGAVDSAIADAILEHAVDLFRLEAGTRARILDLLQKLQKELIGELASADLTAYQKLRTQELLKQTSAIIDDYYAKMQGELELTLQGVGRIQVNQVTAAVNAAMPVRLGLTLPTETFLTRLVSNVLIQGAPSAEWWGRQNQDTASKFANAVRQGLVAGEGNERIVQRVRGVMNVSANNARSLVHTSIQTVANASRRETFRKNADVINSVRQLSTLDAHTTPTCIAYSDSEWTLDGEPVNDIAKALPAGYNGGTPRHWACRSVEVPVTKSFADLGIDLPEPPEAQRASGAGPVNMDFEEWLSRRTVEQQDAQLGKGRAQLWRDGKINLQQLLDMQGNPMTLAQLHDKYA